MKKGLKMEIYKAYTAVTAFIIGMIPFHALAAGKTWPWTNFLNDLQEEMTGPLPTTLGIMGIVHGKCRGWSSEIPRYHSCNLHRPVRAYHRFLARKLILSPFIGDFTKLIKSPINRLRGIFRGNTYVQKSV